MRLISLLLRWLPAHRLMVSPQVYSTDDKSVDHVLEESR